MMRKARMMEDEVMWEKISRCKDGREAKILSKKIKGKDWRKWDAVKEGVMKEAVRLLTEQNDEVVKN